MDIITIGGLVVVVFIVVIACFTIYKLLSRETTFEEIYGNDKVKSLNTEKIKSKGKRIHSRWRQSPRKETDSKEVHNSDGEEVSGDLTINQANEEIEDQPLDSGLSDELKHLRIENEKLNKAMNEQLERNVLLEQTIKNKNAAKTLLDDENKKLLSKNDQFCTQLQKQLEELELLRNENGKLRHEKIEQSERHVIFEQTVKNKLIETHQLCDENKKLRLKCDQFCEQMEKHQSELTKLHDERELAVKEMLKLREDRDLAKSIVEEASKDIRSKDVLIRNMEANLEQLQNENAMLSQEKNDHSVKFESLKNKINETNQLCDENMKLHLKCDQFCEQLEKQKDEHAKLCDEHELVMKELLKLRENYDLVNTIAEQASNEIHSKNALIQSMEMSFDSKNQTLQTEFNAKVSELNAELDFQRSRNQELRNANYKLLDTVKVLQSSNNKTLFNGNSASTNGNIPDNHVKQDSALLIEQLVSENKQFKSALNLLNKQLEEVSKMAMDLEIERDTKVAQIEKMLSEAKS
jgi:chromosome segregation ATPase